MPLGNIGSDYQVFDNTEAVTFFRRTATQPRTFDSGTAVASALRRAARKTHTEGAVGRLAETFLVWHLPATQLGSPDPKASDVIQDGAGVRWSLVEVHKDTFGTRFRCVTVQERASA